MKKIILLIALIGISIISNSQQIISNRSHDNEKLFVKHINLITHEEENWEVKSKSIKEQISAFSPSSKGTTSILSLDENELKSLDLTDSTLYSRNLPENVTLLLDQDGKTEYTNAVLIDPKHILATAHFNFSAANTLGNITVRSINFSNQLNSYDFSQATDIYFFTNDPDDYVNNIALITLEKPLGAFLGWMGFGYSNDDNYFKNNSFFISQIIEKDNYYLLENYSASSPSYVMENSLYYAPYKNIAGGAPFYNIDNAVLGIKSHWATTTNNGETTYYDGISRITQQKSNTILSIINNDKPDEFDLLPLKLRVKPDSINILDPIEELEMYVLNYSKETFNDTIKISIHLNNDNILDDNDPIVKRYNVVIGIEPTHKVSLKTTNGWTLPPTTKTGDYSLAAVIQTVDYNLYNNITLGQDCEYIHVENPYLTNYISGKIVTSGESSGEGWCMLLKKYENSIGGAYAITEVDENLNFEFEDVFIGDYIIVYVPKNSNNHRNIPTYYNQSPYWKNANIITVSTSDTVKNLELERIELSENTGTKSITGILSKSENKTAKSTTDDFFSDVTLILEDTETESIYSACFPDNNGLYKFEKLTDGKYTILVDKPGFTLINSSEITITDEIETISDINFTFYPDSTIEATSVTSSPLYSEKDIQITVFPNPTSEYINITFASTPDKYFIEFYNELGQMLVRKQSVNRIETMDIREVTNGIYYLKIYNENSSAMEKIILK